MIRAVNGPLEELSFPRPTRLGRATQLLSVAAVAHAAAVGVPGLLGIRISPRLLALHALFVLAVVATVALLTAARPRHFAAAVLTLPIALALLAASHSSGLISRPGGWNLLLSAGALSLIVFPGRWIGKMPPQLAALGGGVVAGGVLAVRLELGRSWSGIALCAALGVVLAMVWMAGRRAIRRPARPGVASPTTRTNLLVFVGAHLVAVLFGAQLVPESSLVTPRAGSAADAFAAADRPPVVLIVLDTVRADRLSSYGYDRSTMPSLARFGTEHAFRVERSITNSPLSLPAHASLFTGLTPPRHGVHLKIEAGRHDPEVAGQVLDESIPTLASILSAEGYWTVGLSANFGPLSPSLGLGRGFDLYQARPSAEARARQRFLALTPWSRWTIPARYLGFDGEALLDDLAGVPYRQAPEMTAAALEAIAAAGKQPFFLFLNYLDAHLPYAPPSRFLDAIAPRDAAAARRVRGSRWTRVADPVLAGDRPLTEEERRGFSVLYDAELAFLDSALAPLFAALEKHPRWAEMLVILTADHGEGLGEHGLLHHGGQLFDTQIRVPLLIKPPADRSDLPAAGSSIPGPYESVDLFASILDHAGIASPLSIDGLPWGRGRTVARSWLHRPAHLIAYSPRFDRRMTSVEQAGWKLIVDDEGGRWLFDLERDPLELDNLAALVPRKTAALEALLGELTEDADLEAPESRLDDEERRRLRSLGYVR